MLTAEALAYVILRASAAIGIWAAVCPAIGRGQPAVHHCGVGVDGWSVLLTATAHPPEGVMDHPGIPRWNGAICQQLAVFGH